MQGQFKEYFSDLTEQLNGVKVLDREGNLLEFAKGLEAVVKKIQMQTQAGNKLIFIGNGASASISSHMSTDYWKNGGMRAIAFNDSSLLTCISNDFSYEEVFEKPIKMFADKGDILMAISSSGGSKNILNAARAARETGCSVITFSGFNPKNPLSSMGDYNFYVNSPSYGFVEITHLALCHCICDIIILNKK